jgi:hypothetical protein
LAFFSVGIYQGAPVGPEDNSLTRTVDHDASHRDNSFSYQLINNAGQTHYGRNGEDWNTINASGPGVNASLNQSLTVNAGVKQSVDSSAVLMPLN